MKLSPDLNKGAGGEYVYLCYKPVDYDASRVIKNIAVIGGRSDDIAPPFGYTKVDADLNKGTGGEYIYVCYAKNV